MVKKYVPYLANELFRKGSNPFSLIYLYKGGLKDTWKLA